MSDPRVFRKTKLSIGLDAKRASHTRLIRIALLVSYRQQFGAWWLFS